MKKLLSRIKRSRIKGQGGTILAIVSVAMSVLIGSVVLVIDLGMIMRFRTELHKALDAAVLAAAQDLPNTSTARATLNQYIALNIPDVDAVTDPVVTVSFSGTPFNRISAQASLDVSLPFMRVFGQQTATVQAASSAEKTGVDLVLAIDRSGSMCEDYPGNPNKCPKVGPWQPMDDVKDAAVYFITELAEETMLGLVSYSTYPSTDVPLKYLESEMGEVISGIQGIAPGRSWNRFTDIGGAIHLAVDSLTTGGRQNPKVIVLLSDGRPNIIEGSFYGYTEAPRAYTRQAAYRAEDEGIVIFTIAFGDDSDIDLMDDVADITGGWFYYSPDTDGLYAIFQEIASKDFVRLILAGS